MLLMPWDLRSPEVNKESVSTIHTSDVAKSPCSLSTDRDSETSSSTLSRSLEISHSSGNTQGRLDESIEETPSGESESSTCNT